MIFESQVPSLCQFHQDWRTWDQKLVSLRLWKRRIHHGFSVVTLCIGSGLFHPDGRPLSKKQRLELTKTGQKDVSGLYIKDRLLRTDVVLGMDTGALIVLDPSDPVSILCNLMLPTFF
jgi:hypothetical protein